MDTPVYTPPPDNENLLESLLLQAEQGAFDSPSAPELTPPITSTVVTPPPMPPLSTTAPVSALLSAIIPPAPASRPTATTPEPVGILNGLLGNPAILTALPTLLENLGPLLGGGQPSGGPSSATKPPSRPPDRHTALLCAVKPYLGPERRAAAETVLRLCRIWDALSASGLNLSGLGSLLRPSSDTVHIDTTPPGGESS